MRVSIDLMQDGVTCLCDLSRSASRASDLTDELISRLSQTAAMQIDLWDRFYSSYFDRVINYESRKHLCSLGPIFASDDVSKQLRQYGGEFAKPMPAIFPSLHEYAVLKTYSQLQMLKAAIKQFIDSDLMFEVESRIRYQLVTRTYWKNLIPQSFSVFLSPFGKLQV